MKKILLPIALVGLSITALWKCESLVDDLQFEPTYALPLIEAELSIADVVGANPGQVDSVQDGNLYFFELVYSDTLDPVLLPNFISGGSYPSGISYQLPKDSNLLNLLGRNEDGDFVFTNPSIKFIFDNRTTMGYTLNFNELYTSNVKTGVDYPFNVNTLPWNIKPATNASAGLISEFTVTNDSTTPNGAISDVMNPTPKYLVYQPEMTSQGGSNVEGDRINVYAQVRLPFEGRGRINYADTVGFEFGESDIDEFVDFAILRMRFENSIPIEATISATLIDTSGGGFVIVGALPFYDFNDNTFNYTRYILPGGDDDPNADPIVETTDIRLYKDENNITAGLTDLEALATANAMILNISFNTTGYNVNNDVKIYSTQKLKVNMGIKTKLNVDSEDIGLDTLTAQ